MKKKLVARYAVVCMAAVMTISPMNASAATLLKRGSNGCKVESVQSDLKDLGYYTYSKITGFYGSMTASAVKKFQIEHNLYADGIAGTKTLCAISDAVSDTGSSTSQTDTATDPAITDGSSDSSTDTSSDDQTVKKISGALDWYKQVRYIFAKGDIAVVTDIDTGKSFKVERTYGTNHADVEPLTKADTQTIKDIWGGFSWQRRAVTVEVGDYILAGSMTGMPHAGLDSAKANSYIRNRSDGYGYGVNLDSIKNNGANGVLDIHFLNSRTHTTNIVQKSQQDMVKKAASYLKVLNV